MVLDHGTFPKADNYKGSLNGFDAGLTLVHEAGHYFGLHHTFHEGCAAANQGGDGVADTPAEKYPATGAVCVRDPKRDTCKSKGTDPVTNYMNYAADMCMDTFTRGQAERMHRYTRKFKPTLWAQGETQEWKDAEFSPTSAPTAPVKKMCSEFAKSPDVTKADGSIACAVVNEDVLLNACASEFANYAATKRLCEFGGLRMCTAEEIKLGKSTLVFYLSGFLYST